MAIFGFGKKKSKEPVAPTAKQKVAEVAKDVKIPVAQSASASGAHARVIIRPHITEKATMVTEHNAYVFQVQQGASAQAVAKDIEALYGVKPVKVNLVNMPRKQLSSMYRRGVAGQTKAIRKAYVYLPEGKTIEFV